MRVLLVMVGISLLLGIGKLAGWFLISWLAVSLPVLIFVSWMIFLGLLVVNIKIVRDTLRIMDRKDK